MEFNKSYKDFIGHPDDIPIEFHKDVIRFTCSKSNRNINIPDTFINLKTLCCYGINISEIPNTLINLEHLYCSRNPQLNKIPDTLIKLKSLVCYSTNISEIPDTLINLTELSIDNTNITKIPDTLTKLGVIFYDEKLKKIPITLIHLTYMTYIYNYVNELIKEEKTYYFKPNKILTINRIYKCFNLLTEKINLNILRHYI